MRAVRTRKDQRGPKKTRKALSRPVRPERTSETGEDQRRPVRAIRTKKDQRGLQKTSESSKDQKRPERTREDQ